MRLHNRTSRGWIHLGFYLLILIGVSISTAFFYCGKSNKQGHQVNSLQNQSYYPSPTHLQTRNTPLYADPIPSSVKLDQYGFVSSYNPNQSIFKQVLPPFGYTKVETPASSFGEWLRFLPLYPVDRAVLDYEGNVIKMASQVIRVIQLDNPSHGMQQCADTVIRLWAEYLKSRDQLDQLELHTQNGQSSSWRRWAAGYRPVLKGNSFHWIKKESPTSNQTRELHFKEYITWLMQWTGTLALARDLSRVTQSELDIGHMFVHPNRSGNNIGHISIIVDKAVQEGNSVPIYLIAWGFIPAQDFHIIQPPRNLPHYPWFTRTEAETYLQHIFGEGFWITF
jgi:hypothetical protein